MRECCREEPHCKEEPLTRRAGVDPCTCAFTSGAPCMHARRPFGLVRRGSRTPTQTRRAAFAHPTWKG